MQTDLATRQTSDPRALCLSLDDLRCMDRALCIAAASYRKYANAQDADARQTISDFGDDERECRQLMDRLGRYLACFPLKD